MESYSGFRTLGSIIQALLPNEARRLTRSNTSQRFAFWPVHSQVTSQMEVNSERGQMCARGCQIYCRSFHQEKPRRYHGTWDAVPTGLSQPMHCLSLDVAAIHVREQLTGFWPAACSYHKTDFCQGQICPSARDIPFVVNTRCRRTQIWRSHVMNTRIACHRLLLRNYLRYMQLAHHVIGTQNEIGVPRKICVPFNDIIMLPKQYTVLYNNDDPKIIQKSVEWIT